MTKRSFDDFDGYAKNYREIHTSNVKLSGADSYYFAEHKVKLLREYEQDNNCTFLDLGCGDGTTEMYIHQYFPSFIAEGIDVSVESIHEAQARNIPNCSFISYDGKSVPYNNDRFDIVFVAAVLHHIDFSLHDLLMKEVYRVLKPGGRIYLFEHNPLNPVTRYLVRTCVFDKDAKLLPYTYSNRLLKRNLFRDIKRKFILFFPRKGILSKLIGLEKNLGWLPLGGQYMYRAVK